MQPTYTVDEVLTLLPSLDSEGISILATVVQEETKRYRLSDLWFLQQLFYVYRWLLV
jgi:hypothetical protein